MVKPIGFRPPTPLHDTEIRRRAAKERVSVTDWLMRKAFTADEDAALWARHKKESRKSS